MATIRFASPWTQGLAVGLPAAATAFTQAYESARQRAEREQDRALRQQLFQLQLQQAQQQTQRFQIEQQERERRAAALESLPGLLSGVAPVMTGVAPTVTVPPAGEVPSDPELAALFGPTGEVTSLGRPPVRTTAELIQTPEGAAALKGSLTAGIPLFGQQTGLMTPEQATQLRKKEEDDAASRAQIAEGQRLLVEETSANGKLRGLALMHEGYRRAGHFPGMEPFWGFIKDTKDKEELLSDIDALEKVFTAKEDREVADALTLLRHGKSSWFRAHAGKALDLALQNRTDPKWTAMKLYTQVADQHPEWTATQMWQEVEKVNPQAATIALKAGTAPSGIQRVWDTEQKRLGAEAEATGKGEGEKKVWGPTGKPSTPAATKTIVDLAIQNAKKLWPDNVLRQQAFAEWMKTREEELSGKSLKDIEDKIRQGIAEVEGRHPAPASQAATPEASRGLWQKIRDLFTGRPAPPPAPMAPPANMPDPSAHPGETIRHKPTGKMYRSDGTQWTEVSP